MFDALSLLRQLNEQDIQWLLDSGQERQVQAGTVVIREGARPESLYFVLEGLVGVSVSSAGPRPLASLGPGELLGEISLVEDSPATASVTAAENTLLLCVPMDQLAAKLHTDPWFAQRLYKAFASIASRRLRERVRTLSEEFRARVAAETERSGRWKTLGERIHHFKAELQLADQQAIRHDGQIDDKLKQTVVHDFGELFCGVLNREIGDRSELEPHVRDDLGTRVQVETLPYLLLTQTAERFYSKPRGYAGDFLTIDLIYRNTPAGAGRLGPLLDECFLVQPPAKAVRNRRTLLAEEILRVCQATPGETVRVTSLASGPAAEAFDVLESYDQASRLQFTLVDIDLFALAFVNDKAAKRSLHRQIRPVNGNLVYLATGRQRLDLPPQDLIYSIGLIDYFNDTFVVRLLNYVHGLLKPGGRVILGNFHPANPGKAFMDHVLAWELIHRSEADMNRLFLQSHFARPCTDIRFEAEGINLFAACIKQ